MMKTGSFEDFCAVPFILLKNPDLRAPHFYLPRLRKLLIGPW